MSLIYIDESTMKIGGVILPGVFKSLEIKSDALIEEQEVEGRTTKPKQAIGYEDAKINVELILYDGPFLSKYQKLSIIQNIFKKPGQTKPEVYEIVNEHTATRGITKILFKNLVSKEQNNNEQLSVVIEFWEYITTVITATQVASQNVANKATTISKTAPSTTKKTKGTAPKIKSKTEKSPATDSANTAKYKSKMVEMPY